MNTKLFTFFVVAILFGATSAKAADAAADADAFTGTSSIPSSPLPKPAH